MAFPYIAKKKRNKKLNISRTTRVLNMKKSIFFHFQIRPTQENKTNYYGRWESYFKIQMEMIAHYYYVKRYESCWYSGYLQLVYQYWLLILKSSATYLGSEIDEMKYFPGKSKNISVKILFSVYLQSISLTRYSMPI